MLTAEQNQRLTQVGPGTPMGKLLRLYWQPIAASVQLRERPVRPITLMGEHLTLFRDTRGRLGLVGERCAHRLVALEFGYPVDEGLRCPYHGWTYNSTGQCVAQPAEPDGSSFKDKIKIMAYPVQELAGLVFAYLGPEPAPLLPRWEPLIRPGFSREITYSEIPCNWLQEMENSPDQTHGEWLHGHFAEWTYEARGIPEDDPKFRLARKFQQHVLDHATEPYEYGLIRRRQRSGLTKADEAWTIGQPMIVPNIAVLSDRGSASVIWRTAHDDMHCTQWEIECTPSDSPEQDEVPCQEIPMTDLAGDWNLLAVRGQDHVACMAQGAVMDRTLEHLVEGDRGIIAYRRLLLEQLDVMEAGGEPLAVFRDPAQNECITLPLMTASKHASVGVR